MARGISIDLIVDPKKAIEGLDKVDKKAGSTSSFLADLGKTVGVVAVAATAAIAGAVAGLAAASVAAAQYADDILTAATNTRLSTETLQAYKYAAELIDTPLDTMTTSLSRNIKSMNAAREGTGAQAEAYAALGVAVTDGSGALRDSEKVYWDTIDALGGMQNETERDALAMVLLGKSAADLNSLIAQGSDGFAALTEEAKKNGAVMSGEQLTSLGLLDDALQRFKSTAEAAKNALGLILMPQLTLLGEEGTSLLGEFSTAILDANGDVSAIGPAAGNVLSGLTDMIAKLVDQAVPMVLALADGIVQQLPKLIDTGIQLIVSLVTGIGQALPTLIPSVVKAIVDGILTLTSPTNLNALLKAGLGLITGLVKGIITALPIIIEALPTIILNIVNFIVGAIPQLIDAGIQLLLALIGALPEIITGIVSAIPKIIVGITTALVEAIPALITGGIELFVALIAELPTIIVEIVKAIPEIVVGIVTAFTKPETMARMAQAGMSLIQGLIDGIGSMVGAVVKSVEDVANSIVGGIADFLGIHSPSTVFADIGRYSIMGLEKGLSGKNRIGSIMGDLSSQVANGFDGSLSVNARASARSVASGASSSQTTPTLSRAPQINQKIYMLPEQDPRIFGRQYGRELARQLAGVPT